MGNIVIHIPDEVQNVLDRLHDNGYEAYIVGGCVRDCLLGLNPKDYDVTTVATPNVILRLFSDHKCILTGLEHGTVTVVVHQMPIEITTFREETDYQDYRHPKTVNYIMELKNDLARRDFTINSMAYNPTDGLMDYFNGMHDLSNRVLRCINDPNERFNEDALRIIRALRFSSTYGLTIDPWTAEAIHKNKHLLKRIAVERIANEFTALLTGNHCYRVLVEYVDVLLEFIPELTPIVQDGSFNDRMARIQSVEDYLLRLSILLGQGLKDKRTDEDIALLSARILRRLHSSNTTIKTVSELCRHQSAHLSIDRIQIKMWLKRLGIERFSQLVLIQEANRTISLEESVQMGIIVDDIVDHNECYTLDRLNINGHDIKEIPNISIIRIKDMLNDLLEEVINERVENDHRSLLRRLNKWIADGRYSSI